VVFPNVLKALRHRVRARNLESAYLAAIVDCCDDAIIGTDLHGIVTSWNRAAERIFGYPARELVGRSILTVIPADRADEEHAILASVRRGDKIEHLETVRRRKDGEHVAVSVSVSPIRDDAATIIGASKIVRDITDRKRAEEQIAQSEAKFRALFSDNPLPMWAYDRGTLQMVEVNNAAISKYGYSRAEFTAMRATDIRPPEDVPAFLAALTGEPPAHRLAGVWRHKLRDGRVIDVDVAAHDMELAGRRVTLVAGNDVTAQKQAQNALRESAQMARGIIATALDAFVQIDQAGRIVEWNPQAEAVFGWSREEALGGLLSDMIVPDRHRHAHLCGVADFVKNGEGTIIGRRREIAAVRRDGQEITVELAITALRQRTGYVFNGFIRDVTERVGAEERLRQTQKLEAVGQLTGGVAHDFNNILTVITGTIDILADAVADRPKLAAIARMINEAADRGSELTQRLLAFARKQPLQPRQTDVNGLIVDTAKLLRPALGEQIEIESMLEADIWPALIDPSQLSAALLNLALNARDAMADGGKLTLETGNVVLDESYAPSNPDVNPGAYVMIVVSDTGTGIAEGIRDKVFEPFFTTKEPGKGTGLGLSMVYGFVKQSGGHIKIYSEVGHGTTIRLYLPRAAEPAGQPADAAMPIAPVACGSESILVVEDDALVRDYVITQLASLGYSTLAASNGPEALHLIDEGAQFDLLFTDVIMPGMNGRQLSDEAMKRRPSVKVLYTSGYTENAILHHGRLDPDVLLLAKPYRKSDLARMVRQAIEAAR
jgi:PAS domain S-box-containing protein